VSSIRKDIGTRMKTVETLIKTYNKKVLSYPPSEHRPPILNFKKVTNLLLADSNLWDLDCFQCNEKWAKDPKTRKMISTLLLRRPAQEELGLLTAEYTRLIRNHIDDLNKIEAALLFVASGSLVERVLLKRGTDAATSLQISQDLCTAKGLNGLQRRFQPALKRLFHIIPALISAAISDAKIRLESWTLATKSGLYKEELNASERLATAGFVENIEEIAEQIDFEDALLRSLDDLDISDPETRDNVN